MYVCFVGTFNALADFKILACQHLTCFNCTREITPIARQSKFIKKTQAVFQI